jgi:hypothetical protein
MANGWLVKVSGIYPYSEELWSKFGAYKSCREYIAEDIDLNNQYMLNSLERNSRRPPDDYDNAENTPTDIERTIEDMSVIKDKEFIVTIPEIDLLAQKTKNILIARDGGIAVDSSVLYTDGFDIYLLCCCIPDSGVLLEEALKHDHALKRDSAKPKPTLGRNKHVTSKTNVTRLRSAAVLDAISYVTNKCLAERVYAIHAPAADGNFLGVIPEYAMRRTLEATCASTISRMNSSTDVPLGIIAHPDTAQNYFAHRWRDQDEYLRYSKLSVTTPQELHSLDQKVTFRRLDTTSSDLVQSSVLTSLFGVFTAKKSIAGNILRDGYEKIFEEGARNFERIPHIYEMLMRYRGKIGIALNHSNGRFVVIDNSTKTVTVCSGIDCPESTMLSIKRKIYKTNQSTVNAFLGELTCKDYQRKGLPKDARLFYFSLPNTISADYLWSVYRNVAVVSVANKSLFAALLPMKCQTIESTEVAQAGCAKVEEYLLDGITIGGVNLYPVETAPPKIPKVKRAAVKKKKPVKRSTKTTVPTPAQLIKTFNAKSVSVTKPARTRATR